jgi:hypothetical protein
MKFRTHQRYPVATHWAEASFSRRIRSDDGDLALEPNLKIADSAAANADPRQRMAAMNIEIAAFAQKSSRSEFV